MNSEHTFQHLCRALYAQRLRLEMLTTESRKKKVCLHLEKVISLYFFNVAMIQNYSKHTSYKNKIITLKAFSMLLS